MVFKLEHNSILTTDMKRTVEFYEKAFQMIVKREKAADDREIVFMGSELYPHQVEIIQMNDKTGAYDLGENPTHFAFRTDDIQSAMAFHKEMGCFHSEVPAFGIYFVEDPDGYLCEVMPTR